MSTQTSAPAAADVSQPRPLVQPWHWDLPYLMSQARMLADELGPSGLSALFGLWLSQHTGRDAMLARFDLGTLLHARGQFDAAQCEYDHVLRTMDLPQARYNLGLLLESKGRSREAMAQWLQVAQSGTEPGLRLQALAARISVARRLGQRDALREALLASLALQPDAPALQAELSQLDAAASARATDDLNGPDPVVVVVAPCYNEALMLPHFLEHYVHYVGAQRVVLLDDGSTDGTAEIAARWPQVTFISRATDKLDDRDLLRRKNEGWKPYRNECDWMIVCDIDEFLYHPDMRRVLRELRRDGITLPGVEGYQMIAKAWPSFQPARPLWRDWQSGWPDPRYMNKQLIFDPRIDINYSLGCHNCQPAGPVRRSASPVFKNLHMSMPSHRHVVERSRRSAARMSDWNNQVNIGFHYRLNSEMSRSDYNAKFLQVRNVVEPREQPMLRREGFATLEKALALRDGDPQLLEFGIACDIGGGVDSASTEFFAWVVHTYGGQLHSVDDDVRRHRHAALELERRGLRGDRVRMLDTNAFRLGPPRPIDLVWFNLDDHYGGAADRAESQRRALSRGVACMELLAPDALVGLDGGMAACEGDGPFVLLAALLRGLGWQAQQGADITVWRRDSA